MKTIKLLLLASSLLFMVGCDKEKEYNDITSRDALTGTRWIQKLDNHPLASVFISFYVNDKCSISLYEGDLVSTFRYIYKHPNITITYLSSSTVYASGYIKDDVIYLNLKDENLNLELGPWSMPK